MFHRITTLRIGLAALLTCSALSACAVDASSPPTMGAADQPVIAQLERSRDALTGHGLALELVDYSPANPLDSDDSVQLARAEILDGNALVPQYDGINAGSLQLSTIAERTLAFYAGRDPQDVIANLQSMVMPTIKVGQRAMDVTWSNQGHQFHTKLVYDDQGIVYDNVLSNLALVQTHDVPDELPPVKPAAGAQGAGIVAHANQSFSTRFVDIEITWFWGSTRGRVQLDHYVISCDGWVSFCDDGGQVNAWMSVGSAGGDTRRNALRYPRISKLAWAYGWATPTASFSFSFHPSTATFTASVGGVGSAGKGAGIHTIF